MQYFSKGLSKTYMRAAPTSLLEIMLPQDTTNEKRQQKLCREYKNFFFLRQYLLSTHTDNSQFLVHISSGGRILVEIIHTENALPYKHIHHTKYTRKVFLSYEIFCRINCSSRHCQSDIAQLSSKVTVFLFRGIS